MQTELTKSEFMAANIKKTWIYRVPPPPNRITPRRPRPGKVVVVFKREVNK